MLIDHANSRLPAKRGGNDIQVTFNEEMIGDSSIHLEMIDLKASCEDSVSSLAP